MQAVSTGSVSWTGDTIKVSAHTGSYAYNQATDQFYSDLTNELPTANGYTNGGQALGTKSNNLTGLVVSLRAAATIWTPSTGQTLTIRTLVVRKDTGVAGTSPLLGYFDFGVDTSATGAAFTVNWDATDGVLKLTAA